MRMSSHPFSKNSGRRAGRNNCEGTEGEAVELSLSLEWSHPVVSVRGSLFELSREHWRTPIKRLYTGSPANHPGEGISGLSGHNGAMTA